MILGVESDITYSENDVIKNNTQAISTIHNIISQAFDIVSKQPLLLNLYRQMITSLVSGMSNARQYESVLENCFDSIDKEFNQPEPPIAQDKTQEHILQLQNKKAVDNYAIKKEQNDLKRLELLLKYNSSRLQQKEENK